MNSSADAQPIDDHATFSALLSAWAEAIVANDPERISAFTEPDWELVDRRIIPLSRFLQVVREGILKHTRMSFDVLSVRRTGDVAVVVAHGTNAGEFNGEPFTADEWVTEVFVRREGRWRCQLSALTPRQAPPQR